MAYSYKGHPVEPPQTITVRTMYATLHVPPIQWSGDPKGHIGILNTFFYMVDGECLLTIGNKHFTLRTGQLAFLPKGLFRAYAPFRKGVSLYEYRVDVSFEHGDLLQCWGFTEGGVITIPFEERARIMRCFECTAGHENGDFSRFLSYVSGIGELLQIYIQSCLYRVPDTSSFAAEIINYMTTHLDANLTIDELAKMACMQPTYFIRRFKQAHGASPIAYYNHLRANHALTIMRGGHAGNAYIATAIGISDEYYFSSFFKKHFGVSPDEYRRIMRLPQIVEE